MVHAEKMPRGLILSNMVFTKIGKGGEGEKAGLARLARTILVAYVEPKRFFFVILAGKSPVQPLPRHAQCTAEATPSSCLVDEALE
jgi:hypothetical protein